MKTQAHPIDQHRCARGIRWAQTLLTWLALVLCTDKFRVERRHIRRRYGRIDRLHRIEQFLAALLINHAVAITRRFMRLRRTAPRNAAAAGFRRRLVTRPSFRTILGSRLRRTLRHRDLVQRIRRLWSAFGNIDALARTHLVKRLKRGLTRICPILVIAPPSAALLYAAPAVALADSS